MVLRSSVLALGLLACGGALDDTAGDADGPVDLRVDFPDPPEGGIQLLSEPMVIPAGSERIYCLLMTYDGPTVGINSQESIQSGFGHHMVLNATNASYDLYADGELVDCTEGDALPMSEMDPLFFGAPTPEQAESGRYTNTLPAGMGARLKTGTRLVIESHYVNTSTDDILVQDAVNLGLIPEADVETWAAPVLFLDSGFRLEPGVSTTVAFDCEIQDALSMLYLGPHMHEWGTAFSLTYTSDGQTTTLFDLPTWDPAWRDLPPVEFFDPGEFTAKPGDVFRTSCTWFNTTDLPMELPQEMCVTFGMGYPAKVAVTCDAG